MVGDFGNLQADQFGQVNIKKDDIVASISGGNMADITGRSLVVSFSLYYLFTLVIIKAKHLKDLIKIKYIYNKLW